VRSQPPVAYRAEESGWTGRREQGGCCSRTAAPCRRETRRGGVLMGWRNASVLLPLHSAGEREEGDEHAGGGAGRWEGRHSVEARKARCYESMRNWGRLNPVVILIGCQRQGLPQAHKDGPPSAVMRRCTVGRPHGRTWYALNPSLATFSHRFRSVYCHGGWDSVAT
jgi:hypothetical protein